MKAARIALAGVFVLCACATGSGLDAGCPLEPVGLAELRDALPLRARLRFQDGMSVEAVAALESGELVVVGLAPFGTRLFTLRRADGAPRVASTEWGRAGPPPLWVLDALSRIFWIRAPREPEAERPVTWERGGERIVESVENGRRRRRYARVGNGAGEVSIEYPAERAAPSEATIVIRNPWCAYEGRVIALGGAR